MLQFLPVSEQPHDRIVRPKGCYFMDGRLYDYIPCKLLPMSCSAPVVFQPPHSVTSVAKIIFCIF